MIASFRNALLFVILVCAALNADAQALSDARFGTVGGNKEHWQWYRGYNQDYTNISLPLDQKKLWTIGKLDDPLRDLSFNDWCVQNVPSVARVHPLNCDRESDLKYPLIFVT